jgi:hypothetical protein
MIANLLISRPYMFFLGTQLVAVRRGGKRPPPCSQYLVCVYTSVGRVQPPVVAAAASFYQLPWA